MDLISESYKKLNEELHQTKPSYGAGGYKDAKVVKRLIKQYQCADVLDYGCGKATLSRSLGWFAPKVYNYDPAIPEYSVSPVPADLVVCTDVLEHLEPEYLGNVLDNLRDMTKKVLYLSVATRPAKKVLSDGRNAHLIQEPAEWWLPLLRQRFTLKEFWGDAGDLYIVAIKK